MVWLDANLIRNGSMKWTLEKLLAISLVPQVLPILVLVEVFMVALMVVLLVVLMVVLLVVLMVDRMVDLMLDHLLLLVVLVLHHGREIQQLGEYNTQHFYSMFYVLMFRT